MDAKKLEAEEKLTAILKKARSFGIKHSHLKRLTASHKLDFSSPVSCKLRRTFLLSVIIPVVLAAYSFGLYNPAWNIYQDWRDGVKQSHQCVIPVPDTWNRVFRPPVHCFLCQEVTEVEKVSSISVEVFENRYAYSGRPVIITDATDNWTAPQYFSFEFFKSLYEDRLNSHSSQQCQFFPYKTNFSNLGEFLKAEPQKSSNNSPWYVGWSNCDVEVTEILRQHYERPYFLPPNAEGKRLDWTFMGSKGYGAPMHVDNVEYPSWQAQLRGRKKWRLQPPPECFYVCNSLEVIVETGETIVLDTNRWYHSTEIVSEEVSITIGAEFD